MIELSTFAIEICLSLTVSALALFLLKGALQEVLVDLCLGEQRAKFWARFTQLMLIIGPLLGTLLLTPGSSYTETFNTPIFRETLKHALLGGFFTLCGIAIVIWQTIPRNSVVSRPETENLSPSTPHKA